MYRHYHQDSSNMCCYGRSEDGYRHKHNCLHQKDSSSENEKEYLGLPKHGNFCKNNRPHNNCHAFDNESGKTLSTLKENSCWYSESMEEATAADPLCSHGVYPNENQHRNASLLRRANDLIDYAPESEFLKKIKQQCQYLQNSQPNIFFSIDNFIENDTSPYECQKCEIRSNPVSRQRRQLNCDKTKSVSEKSWKCTCNEQRNVTSANDDQVLNKNFTNVQKQCKGFKAEKQLNEKQGSEKAKVFKKKSEHVSRSKKPTQCGGRRKRKSASLEKCESINQFEPTLKKPHENSCERCWRFASPSRSPVNKPNQKYDPNFRRGHSCMDLEKGDGNIIARESELENFEPIIYSEKERSPRPFCCMQQKSHVARAPPISVWEEPGSILQPSICTSAKVKELLNEQSLQKPLENYLPRARTTNNSQIHKTGLSECYRNLPSNSKGKLRPKSCTPGLSSPETCKCSNGINDYDITEYKTICMNPRKHFCDSSNTSKSLKIPGSVMPSTHKDSSATFSGGGSPGRTFDHASLKPIPEAVVASSKENKNETSKVTTSKTSKNLKEIPKIQSKTENPVKNSKASTSKKPAAEAKNSKGKQKSASSKGKNVRLETKFPKKCPQTSKSQADLNKYKCSQDILENFCSDKEKSQSTTKEYPYNPKLSCGNTVEHHKNSHPVRDCWCYPRIQKSKNNMDNQSGHIFCCHCYWGENQKSQPNRHSFKSSFDVHPVYEENVGSYREPNTESNERRFMKNPDSRACDCSYNRKTSSPESSLLQSPKDMRSASPGINADFSERMMSCPYKKHMNKKMPSKFSNSPESGGSRAWEKEYQSSKKNQKACEDKEFFTGCSPRKYFVFYMTNSKEHKKGDDVEVLVEEFAPTCADAKDMRTKDITEKMKKILECPPDSMALRFQKGVTETCKTPPSSRILYF